MEYFFIVGCQRSGTTVLQQALNRHSRLVIPPETGFFTHFLGHTRTGQRCHVETINRDLGVHLPKPRRRIHRTPDVRAHYDELARQYVTSVGRPDVALFGEKTPHHILQLRRIARHFPNAKLILVYRDGRDVALSLTKVPWFSNDLHVCFGYWLRCCRRHQWALRSPRLRVHLVRYESFVESPERALREVCAFLEVAYEASLCAADGTARGVAHAEADWMALVSRPITTARTGLWRQELTNTQARALESWGWRTLTKLGYDVSPSARHRLALTTRLHGCAATVLWRSGNALRVLRKNILGIDES